ncbi:Hypothetical predicted protein [Pelobates cultripes]|uniref:Uncharacterized protein n=1 Tax=Pelobates cultripes TaxID=61616 RepID=A0AAD1WAY5_PELCU|nr:Hypothetical predicted protein [Pelobates cultripes]
MAEVRHGNSSSTAAFSGVESLHGTAGWCSTQVTLGRDLQNMAFSPKIHTDILNTGTTAPIAKYKHSQRADGWESSIPWSWVPHSSQTGAWQE